MLIIIANAEGAGDGAVDALGGAAVVQHLPGDGFAAVNTTGIAADAAATATTAATVASTVAGATGTTAASGHVQAEPVGLVWLRRGLSVLAKYLRGSDGGQKLRGDNWSRIGDPGDVRGGGKAGLRGSGSKGPALYAAVGKFGHLKVWTFGSGVRADGVVGQKVVGVLLRSEVLLRCPALEHGIKHLPPRLFDLFRRPAYSLLEPLGGEPQFDLLFGELRHHGQVAELGFGRVGELAKRRLEKAAGVHGSIVGGDAAQRDHHLWKVLIGIGGGGGVKGRSVLVKDLVGPCRVNRVIDSGPRHSWGCRSAEGPVLEFRHINQQAGIYTLSSVYLSYLHGVRNHNLFVLPLGFHHFCDWSFGEGNPSLSVVLSIVCKEALLHCCDSIPRIDS